MKSCLILDLAAHGLTQSDLRYTYSTLVTLRLVKSEATLGEMVQAMEATYTASIGAEYMHIVDTKEKRWIQQRLEGATWSIWLQLLNKKNMYLNV